MLTMAAADGPNAKPATRQTTPDGSYLSHGAAGMSGNSMKLSAIASATNNAYIAMRRVDQRPRSPTPVECALSGRRLRNVEDAGDRCMSAVVLPVVFSFSLSVAVALSVAVVVLPVVVREAASEPLPSAVGVPPITVPPVVSLVPVVASEGMVVPLDVLIVSSVSFIRTMTVGFGIRPRSTACAGCGLRRRRIVCATLPPVRNCTFPETYVPICIRWAG